MTTLVEMISMIEKNIKELEEKQKQNEKEFKRIVEEKDNIVRDLKMNRKMLDDLTGIKEEEINQVMTEDKSNEEKVEVTTKKSRKYNNKFKIPVLVIAKDEKGETIAEYESMNDAAKDLNVVISTVSNRIRKMDFNKQVRKYGYGLTIGG